MATTTNYSWSTPDDTALVKDGAAAIRSLGTAIDTTVFNNAGAAIAKTIVDAKGDIIAATAADTVARLAVGATNGMVLTVDSSTATGLAYALPAGGGKVLQVVQGTTTTQTTIASTSDTDTGITATITPTLATSKILVIVNGLFQSYRGSLAGNQQSVKGKILRGATTIVSNNNDYISTFTAGGTFELNFKGPYAQTYLDSPATTSATTYKVQSAVETTANSGAVYWQYNSSLSTITLLEIGA